MILKIVSLNFVPSTDISQNITYERFYAADS